MSMYLCEQLFKESANESSNLVPIQQVKLSIRVSVVVNYSVCITIKGTTTLPWINVNTFTERGGGKERSVKLKTASVHFFLFFFVQCKLIWHTGGLFCWISRKCRSLSSV